MAERTKELHFTENISVTPFGIDVEKFSPRANTRDDEKIIIGTVKKLSPKYGIDILIKSFFHLKENIDAPFSKRLRLVIVGEGKEKAQLEKLAEELGISDVTTFTGRVPHQDVSKYLNQFDMYVALSRFDSESFGVAILEASSCGLPVVVSDVGGLSEVVVEGKTGCIVKSESPQEASEKLKKLAVDSGKRRKMGKAGRDFVVDNYNWEESVDKMLKVYKYVSGNDF